MKITMRFLRDRRRSLGWWSLAMVGLVFVNVVFYPSFRELPTFDQLFDDLPEGVRSLFGVADIPLTEPAGFLHSQIFTTLLPIALVIFAIGLGARAIGGSEDDGTLELLLSNPVSRARVALERSAAVGILVVALGLVASVVLLVVAPPFELLDGVSVYRLLAACAATTCLALLHGAIAFAAGAIFGGRGRSLAVASAVAVGGYVLFGLVSSNVITGTRFLTPWYWFLNRNIVAFGPSGESVFLPLGLSLLLGAVGIWRFGPRDLR